VSHSATYSNNIESEYARLAAKHVTRASVALVVRWFARVRAHRIQIWICSAK